MASSPQQAVIESAAAGAAFGFGSDVVEIQLSLAAAGCGIAMPPDFMAAGRPDLIAVDPGASQLIRDVWMIVHSDMAGAAPIRAVMQALQVITAGGYGNGVQLTRL